MDTHTAPIAYSTSSTGDVTVGELDRDLYEELGLYSLHSERASEYDFPVDMRDYLSEYDDYYDWCEVCLRATDHRGEHDDLVEQGLASYDPNGPRVFSHR